MYRVPHGKLRLWRLHKISSLTVVAEAGTHRKRVGWPEKQMEAT